MNTEPFAKRDLTQTWSTLSFSLMPSHDEHGNTRPLVCHQGGVNVTIKISKTALVYAMQTEIALPLGRLTLSVRKPDFLLPFVPPCYANLNPTPMYLLLCVSLLVVKLP